MIGRAALFTRRRYRPGCRGRSGGHRTTERQHAVPGPGLRRPEGHPELGRRVGSAQSDQVAQDDGLTLSRGQCPDGTVQRRAFEHALAAVRAAVVDELEVARADPDVPIPVGAALPDPVDGATVRDRADPGDGAVRGVEPVRDLPDLEEDVLRDLLGLPRIHELVPDEPFHEGSEPDVEPLEGGPVPGCDGEEQGALLVPAGEKFLVHAENMTYIFCTLKYTRRMRQERRRADRTLTAKGRATRDRIVDVAAELVLTRGVAGTTLDDIGAAASVGRSQVYHYFADKRALVHEVVRGRVRAIVDRQTDDSEPLDNTEAWQRWRDRVVAGVTAASCVGGCPLGSLASELAEQDDDARQLAAAGFARWERHFADGLRAMRARGALAAAADPEELATLVMVALQGGLLLAQVQRDVRPLVVGLDAALDAVRRHVA